MEPDFGRLPPGTDAVFTGRIGGLPVEALHRRLDADAIMHNELEFRRRSASAIASISTTPWPSALGISGRCSTGSAQSGPTWYHLGVLGWLGA